MERGEEETGKTSVLKRLGQALVFKNKRMQKNGANATNLTRDETTLRNPRRLDSPLRPNENTHLVGGEGDVSAVAQNVHQLRRECGHIYIMS